MLFNSFEFLLVFLPLVLVGFYLIGSRWSRPAALGWLLLASVLFYGSWNPAYLWLLAASLLFNYTSSWWIENKQNHRRTVLTCSVAGNVLLLFYYKVLIAGLFDPKREMTSAFSTTDDVLIPLAISFITFQQIAFLVDTYKGGLRKAGWMEYCLFITFFPQLVMGPIVHYRELIPQLRAATITIRRWDNIALGLSIFIIGLFKKVILADGISPYVDGVYTAIYLGQYISPLDAFGAAFGFSLELYFDFSGYADMAVGLARMFNINLPINFDSPFRALNRFDYWRRWHISFGAFMRQYLFFPLARSKLLKVGPAGALALTTFISSIWHGISPTFIVWGGLQGLLMLTIHYREGLFNRFGWKHQITLFRPWGSMLLTFCMTLILGVFFRSKGLDVAFSVFENMHKGISFLVNGDTTRFAFECLLDRYDMIQLMVMSVIVWGLPTTQRFFSDYWTALDQRPRPPTQTPTDLLPGAAKIRFSPKPMWAAGISLMLFMVLANMQGTARFIYFQF